MAVPASGPTAMTPATRVAVGVWIVVLLGCGLLVSSGLAGAGVTGTAGRAAPPDPLPVGSCLRIANDLDPVACSQEHTEEIVLSWTGQRPPMTSTTDSDPAGDPTIFCHPVVTDLLGDVEPRQFSPEISWYRVMPPWSVDVVHGPAGVHVPDWSWTACVVSVIDHTGEPLPFAGTFSDLWNGDDIPDAARSCSRWIDGGDELWQPCSAPHTAELVAQAEIPLPLELLDLDDIYAEITLPAELRATADDQCGRLAEEYLGAPLSTHAPHLRSELVNLSTFYSWESEGAFDGDGAVEETPVAGGAWGECRIAVDDLELTGAVAGLGTAPLPVG